MNLLSRDMALLAKQSAESREEWLDIELRALCSEIREFIEKGRAAGWWRTDEEFGERFGINRIMAIRLRNGNYELLGRHIVLEFALVLGINFAESPYGSGGKRLMLLRQLFPALKTGNLIPHGANEPTTDKLIQQMGHLDWDSSQDNLAFDRWLALRVEQFAGHEYADLCAAATWLRLRPELPSYPDFLLSCAREKLTPGEFQSFHDDIEIVGKLRRAGLKAQQKRQKQIEQAATAQQQATELFVGMCAELQLPMRRRGIPSILRFMQYYQLEPMDLLSLTHGQLLDKSAIIQAVTKKLFC